MSSNGWKGLRSSWILKTRGCLEPDGEGIPGGQIWEHVSQSRGRNKHPMWPGWAGGPAPRCLLGEGKAMVSVANPASVLL